MKYHHWRIQYLSGRDRDFDLSVEGSEKLAAQVYAAYLKGTLQVKDMFTGLYFMVKLDGVEEVTIEEREEER